MAIALTQTWNRKSSTVYTRAILRAIEIAGSPDALAAFLGSSSRDVNTWSRGEAYPPMPIFMAIVDIVAANALTPAALENLPIARARRSNGGMSD
jgi:DNA-binding transcriptional regulator YdaS (Cro superfamily)